MSIQNLRCTQLLNVSKLKVLRSTVIGLCMSCVAYNTHADDAFPSLEVSGKIMLDADYFDATYLENPDNDDSSTEFEARRLRLSFKSQLSKNWEAKFSLDASDGADGLSSDEDSDQLIEIKDAYISYKASKNINIVAGQHREPFGLERLMSSSKLFQNERSLISSAIAPGRSLGLSVAGNTKDVSWQLGYFVDNGDIGQRSLDLADFENADTKNTHAITGRLAWEVWDKGNSTLHFGASFSQRDYKGVEYRVNETLEMNTADSLIEGTRFNAQDALLGGVELLWQYKGLVSMAEYQQSRIEDENGIEYTYDGAYLQLSYLLSGKSRKYKNGLIKGVKKDNDWELTARYSELSLDKENAKAKVFSTGLNYYLNEDWKLMGQYSHADYSEDGIDVNGEFGSGNALSFRVQYTF